ncbi:MAG: helix-turn-helix domain-containing protein [Ruminococcus sp.]|jgi:DNA-binding XRE family transcriptional regulator/desulfoferrodoxin (superoxide reductase-like protein)|nr:helix-turn-helix domain-containing protein [Ruminococcus sp.]
MDNVKIGQLILRLRKENNMTQLQLAEKMGISDKAVSKWERGLGCPDIELLTELAGIFNVDLEKLLSGDIESNSLLGGNLKKICFYVCPVCGNVITSISETGVSCCGKKLKMLNPEKAEENNRLNVEIIENEYFISSDHEMTREHYISFIAFLTSDTLILRKQYPEWNLQTRLPFFAHGRLIWYCTRHGLFYQDI